MIIFHLKAIMKFLHSIVLSSCTNGTVRLMNGSTSDEVCVNGEWGTVCDSGWDRREAEVVCRQL